MPWSNQGGGGGWRGGNGGPWGSPPSGGGGQGGQPPDLEEILRRSQDRLKNVMPGGSMGGKGLALVLLVLIALWGLSGFYLVNTDEQGVVLRFGNYSSTTGPGLHYHLPYPIETVETPQVTRINRIDIGMRILEDGRASRDVPEESLILTGDENIVDVDVSVFWKISNAPDYLFKIQNPQATVKAVAESAMREVIGRSQLQPVLTQARAITEQDVQTLIQQTLDSYSAGIEITQVQLQKVDPPAQVIDAFRDVQAARADQERLRNEAQAYANRVVPEARGQAAQITQQAEAYRERTVNEAKGQASRFDQVYGEYSKAPEVTRERLFLETMERVLGQTDKIIIDEKSSGSGVVPYLPLDQLNRSSSSRSSGTTATTGAAQ